jgi:hypothetical protein
MKRTLFSASILTALALFPQSTLVAADEATKQEQLANEIIGKGLDAVLSKTLEEVEKRAKEGGKDAPTLLKDESKPLIGFYVYSEGGHRSYYHGGKMVRIDMAGRNAVRDVLSKLAKPEKGPKYSWMQVPDKEARERSHWTFQTIVEQKVGDAVQQAPWTYICEFTILKDGGVTVSFIDAERAAALDKALAGK